MSPKPERQSWSAAFPVTAEVWNDVDHDLLYQFARKDVPDGYIVTSQNAHHVPATVDEYGEKPESWVIVIRAAPIDYVAEA